MNTGSRLGGDPAIGSWTTYGLGSENQKLPGYVVMTELALPQGGSRNWSNGFLPAYYQGTRLRPKGSPILDLKSPEFKSREHQRKALNELAFLNEKHADRHPEHANLAARMENYELAYRMQTAVPDVIDLNQEPKHLQEAYGLDDPETESFGKQCLMARRLVENGVRFVQIFAGGWDSHDYLERGHSSRIRSVDKTDGGTHQRLEGTWNAGRYSCCLDRRIWTHPRQTTNGAASIRWDVDTTSMP